MEFVWDILSWFREYRLERLRLQLAAQTAPYDAMRQMVATMAATGEANTKVLQTWMESFTTTTHTASTTMRDEDEIRLELERLGFERPELHESMDAAIKSGQFGEFRNIINEIR